MRTALLVALFGCCSSAASTVSKPQAQSLSPLVESSAIEEEEEYKNSEEWWKDPWALFDDEEEQTEPLLESQKEGIGGEQNGKELSVLKEDDISLEPFGELQDEHEPIESMEEMVNPFDDGGYSVPIDDLEQKLMKEYEELERLEDPTTAQDLYGSEKPTEAVRGDNELEILELPQGDIQDNALDDTGDGEESSVPVVEIVQPVEVEPENAPADPTQMEEELVILSDADINKVLMEQRLMEDGGVTRSGEDSHDESERIPKISVPHKPEFTLPEESELTLRDLPKREVLSGRIAEREPKSPENTTVLRPEAGSQPKAFPGPLSKLKEKSMVGRPKAVGRVETTSPLKTDTQKRKKAKRNFAVTEAPLRGELVEDGTMQVDFSIARLALFFPRTLRTLVFRRPFTRILAIAVVLKAVFDPLAKIVRRDKVEEEDEDDDEETIMRRAEEEEAREEKLAMRARKQQEEEEAKELKRRKREEERQARKERLKNGAVDVGTSWISNLIPGRAERLPSSRALMEKVQRLQAEAKLASADKETIEREYEKTSWQLQEAQTDLASLSSTTRYLKAQLRDNEEIMNRAIDAERRKARGELMRMKEAMLNILERERKAMRDEVSRESAHIKAMMRNTTATTTTTTAES